MFKNKKLILSGIAAIMLSITGCQTSNLITVESNNQSVVVPKSPKKIVVMNYGSLDTLDALGKGSLVVGTSLPVIPTYLQQYKNTNVADTGSMKAPNLETIKQLKPDLIIIDGRQASKYEELTKIAPVLNLSIDAKNYLQSTQEHINLLGELTNTQETANVLIQSLQNKISQAQTEAQKSNKKAIVAIHNDGKVILINNSSSATLIHDVLNVSRAVPLTQVIMNSKEKPKPTFIDNQYIATIKPDIVYIVDRSKAIGNQAMANDYFDAKVLKKSKTKIVNLSADIWYLSGGGLESLDRQIDEVVDSLK